MRERLPDLWIGWIKLDFQMLGKMQSKSGTSEIDNAYLQ